VDALIESSRLGAMLDRQELSDLVRTERLWRDLGKWSEMASLYVEDSYARTTWFEGTGAEFAEASKDQALNRSRHSKHPITPTHIEVVGDRATVESVAEIQNRSMVEGVEVDMTMYCRFFSRAVRTSDGWRLASFEGIYQKDSIVAVDPRDPLPVDWDEVRGYRDSYRIWTWSMRLKGYSVNQNLIGDDRPDLVAAFYRDAEEWLHQG